MKAFIRRYLHNVKRVTLVVGVIIVMLFIPFTIAMLLLEGQYVISVLGLILGSALFATLFTDEGDDRCV